MSKSSITRSSYIKKHCKDWETLKLAYINGIVDEETGVRSEITKEEISEALKIEKGKLSRVIEDGKWDVFRELYKKKIKQKKEKETMMLLLSEGAKYEHQQLRNYEKITKIIENKLDEVLPTNRIYNENGEVTDSVSVEVVRDISAKDLQSLTNTLVTCRQEINNIIGEGSTMEQIAEEIEDMRRIETEKEVADDRLKLLKAQISEMESEKKKLNKKKSS